MTSADRYYVSHGGHDEPHLALYQAWWGMEGIGSNGEEWSFEEKLARIREAKFDGILLFDIPDEGPASNHWREHLEMHSLELAIGTWEVTLDKIAHDVERAKALGASFVNLQPFDYFIRGDAAVELLDGATRIGRELGVPCVVETHRACVTQDLLRTVDLVEAIPEMVIAADFSHYVVAGQLPCGGEQWPIRTEIEEAFEIVLERTAVFHGRVSNGQQVQVDVGPDGDHPAALNFERWWSSGMSHWLDNAGPGDVLPFVAELGPPPYGIIAPPTDGITGNEASDRWEQSIVMTQIAQRAWANATAGR